MNTLEKGFQNLENLKLMGILENTCEIQNHVIGSMEFSLTSKIHSVTIITHNILQNFFIPFHLHKEKTMLKLEVSIFNSLWEPFVIRSTIS